MSSRRESIFIERSLRKLTTTAQRSDKAGPLTTTHLTSKSSVVVKRSRVWPLNTCVAPLTSCFRLNASKIPLNWVTWLFLGSSTCTWKLRSPSIDNRPECSPKILSNNQEGSTCRRHCQSDDKWSEFEHHTTDLWDGHGGRGLKTLLSNFSGLRSLDHPKVSQTEELISRLPLNRSPTPPPLSNPGATGHVGISNH